jgi:hypothetical protein
LLILFALAESALAHPLDERVTGLITPDQGLTADEAARRARAASLELAAERSEVAARRSVEQGDLGNLVVAPGAEPDPLPAGTVLVNAPLSLPVLLDQDRPLGRTADPGQRPSPARRPGVAAARAAESQATTAAGQRVETEARLAYTIGVRARLQVPVAEQSVEQARAHLGDVRKALDVGSAGLACSCSPSPPSQQPWRVAPATSWRSSWRSSSSPRERPSQRGASPRWRPSAWRRLSRYRYRRPTRVAPLVDTAPCAFPWIRGSKRRRSVSAPSRARAISPWLLGTHVRDRAAPWLS